ncbi:MAG: radical SAM protein [Bacteroidota bacterium]|nr:radical SAM protein [Bacteroidota bacterium]
MFDQYNRLINYLRISVTDRCNLRCVYCMPAEGIQLMQHNDILSYEEMYEVAKTGASMGINKIRITGGEPLVRKGIVGFVEMLSGIKEIKDLGMTTNGILLEKYAGDLATAGLHRINISLDTMNADKFRQITRGGNINSVFRGIEAAAKANLLPIKINTVIRNNKEETDAVAVKEYCEKNDLEIRYIHVMELSKGEFSVVEGGEGGDCANCNRLRLTANGMINPCLFSNIGYSVRKLGSKEAIRQALENKPACGTVNEVGQFYNIGG